MRGAVPPPQYVFVAWCLVHRDKFTLTVLSVSAQTSDKSTPVTFKQRKGKLRVGINTIRGTEQQQQQQQQQL
jgi:hypothetical protein